MRTQMTEGWVINSQRADAERTAAQAEERPFDPANVMQLGAIEIPANDDVPDGHLIVDINEVAVDGNVPILIDNRYRTLTEREKDGDNLIVPINAGAGTIVAVGNGCPAGYDPDREGMTQCGAETNVHGQSSRIWGYDARKILGAAARRICLPWQLFLLLASDYAVPRGERAKFALRGPTAMWQWYSVWELFKVMTAWSDPMKSGQYTVRVGSLGGGVGIAFVQIAAMMLRRLEIPHKIFFIAQSAAVGRALEEKWPGSITFIDATPFNRFRTPKDVADWRKFALDPDGPIGGPFDIFSDNIGGDTDPDPEDKARRRGGAAQAVDSVLAPGGITVISGWLMGADQVIQRAKKTVMGSKPVGGQESMLFRHYCPLGLCAECLPLYPEMIMPQHEHTWNFETLPDAVYALYHGQTREGVKVYDGVPVAVYS